MGDDKGRGEDRNLRYTRADVQDSGAFPRNAPPKAAQWAVRRLRSRVHAIEADPAAGGVMEFHVGPAAGIGADWNPVRAEEGGGAFDEVALAGDAGPVAHTILTLLSHRSPQRRSNWRASRVLAFTPFSRFGSMAMRRESTRSIISAEWQTRGRRRNSQEGRAPVPPPGALPRQRDSFAQTTTGLARRPVVALNQKGCGAGRLTA